MSPLANASNIAGPTSSRSSSRLTTTFRYADLRPVNDIMSLLDRLGSIIAQDMIQDDKQTETLLKVVLVKLHDEEEGSEDHEKVLLFQDFSEADESSLRGLFEKALLQALKRFEATLGFSVRPAFNVSGAALRRISLLLCESRLFDASLDAIHGICMRLRKGRADTTNEFLPWEVTQLFAELIGPRPGEQIVDLTCGSGDFLAAAMRVLRDRHKTNSASSFRGYDSDRSALRWAALGILLSGGRGPVHLEQRDSLREPPYLTGLVDIAFCIPTFGRYSVERRAEVLSQFQLVEARVAALGRQPVRYEIAPLHMELSLRSVKPGGRVGIVIPNGYLGNRQGNYIELIVRLRPNRLRLLCCLLGSSVT